MGFYAPAQIVRDVREHGVEVRPVDVNHSDWDVTLEPGPPAVAGLHALHRDMAADIRSSHALRLGFRKIKGLRAEDAKRLLAARCDGGTARPYESVRDLWLRTELSPRTIERLADADAFGSLGLTRRQALWAAKGLGRVGDKQDDLPLFRANAADLPGSAAMPAETIEPDNAGAGDTGAALLSSGDSSLHTPFGEPDVQLPPMTPGEEIVHDYRSLELSLRAHPASFLRCDLTRLGIIRNEDLRAKPSGAHVIVSGLVTIRQQPGSAHGVIFMTIEDETAVANIIVWPKTFARFRPVILGARYVAVSGQMQQESGVIHVVAEKLIDLTALLARLTEDAPAIESLARVDAVKRPHDEDIDSRARGRRNPPRIAAPASLADLLASDLDVPARGSAHKPSRRGGTKIVRG
jgi:error-prone DNA polymerase